MAGNPIEEFIRQWDLELNAAHPQGVYVPSEYNPVIWNDLADETYELEWLIDGLWPVGKHLHMFAAHKTGKSLVTLQGAVGIAMGRDPFTGVEMPKRHTTYVDNEMTRQDLQERLFDMGLMHAMKNGELDHLHYHFYPPLGPLDTVEGGVKLMQWVEQDKSEAVIIDTLSRVVKGEENSNDTYRDFFNYTGSVLKAKGIALLRLDHEGHQTGRSRGASSKADDVDLVYQLKKVDQGLELELKFSRVSYVKKSILLASNGDLLHFTSDDSMAWPAGTADRAKELDSLGVPDGLTVRGVQRWLRERELPLGKNAVLTAAIKYRNQIVP